MVNQLKVKHIVVCGHYGCGGIQAAISRNNFDQVLNMWLRNIKDVYRLHRQEIDGLHNGDERTNRLVELTVKEQVMNLAKTSIIQKAWEDGNAPHLHGWVYSIEDGIIKPIFEMPAHTHIDPIYEYEKNK